MEWLRRLLRRWLGLDSEDSCSVSITIADTVAFTGTVESFDIHTELDGSDASCIIKFKAKDMIKRLTAIARRK